jgi:hypothetical protein
MRISRHSTRVGGPGFVGTRYRYGVGDAGGAVDEHADADGKLRHTATQGEAYGNARTPVCSNPTGTNILMQSSGATVLSERKVLDPCNSRPQQSEYRKYDNK